MSTRKGEMPMNDIVRILDDVSKWQIPLYELVPVNYGEFLLRKDWYEILSMITTKLPKTQIVLPTNGSTFTVSNVERLCHIPTMHLINFSINAYFDETYKEFMNMSPKVLTMIERACKILRALRPDIKLWASMVSSPRYQTDIERDMFKKHWSDKVDMVWVINAASAGRDPDKPLIRNSVPCRSIFSDIVVGYDMKLSSCCFDSAFHLSLGEYSGDLKRDWHNKELTELRRKHNENERKDTDLCRECSFA